MKSLSMKFFILLLLIISPSYTETLKIVYNSGTPPLKFTDADGNANGMLIETWKLWAQKNNVDIKFIEASWEETLSMIKDGRADIHAGIYYTKDREKFLDYSSQSLYENKSYFFYNKSVVNIKSKNELKPFVIGVGNGYPNSFMENEYKGFYTQKFKSGKELNEAFVEDKLNVVLSSMAGMTYFIQKNNYDIKKYRYSDKTYAYTKKYFGAVKQGNKKILSLINNGFENISQLELEAIQSKWTTLLNTNYLKDSHRKDILLSQKHKNYLIAKKEIKMCVDPSWLPFEAIKDGKHIGIIADIFEEFNKYLPVPIRLIQTNTWSESIKFIKNNKCDILSGVTKTENREKYLNFTKPYIQFPHVLVTRENEPFIEEFEDILDKKVGIIKDTAIVEFFKKKYPDTSFVEVKNVSEGLLKVSQGELFGFVDGSASVSYYISQEGLTNLKIASKVGISYYLSVGIKKENIFLLDIFNNMLYNIDTKKLKNIKNHWLQVKVQEVIDYTIIYKTIAFFLFIIVIILYWNRKLNDEITQKVKLQKELGKLSQVIEQSRVSVIITDLHGKIEYVNPFCITQSGYAKNELLGKNPNILKSGYQNEDFYTDLWSTIRSGKTWQGEFSNKRKDGSIFWESAIIAPIFDENKTIKSFASIKENITDKVIARDKLELAQEEAVKANGAKSEFLAKMSHEIRTPMNAVLGMLYLLDQTKVSVIQDNYITKANHAANSLLGIINDILDFSKIEAGKLDINNEEFEFNSMIMDVLSVMSFKTEEKNLELLAYYDDSMPSYIVSDKLRVGQILTNLISNAIKFTGTGEVLISSKLIKEKRDNIEIMFCVKDSGIGISQSSQEKLFQEFSQVDSSATRNFEGTGLGLAICKKLSELLGGKIWIEESKEGVGSTFCFTIKCKKTDTVIKRKYDVAQISNLKCLVVDDNSSAVQILTKMLESFKYEVESVLNGRDAIKCIKNNKYDIVFLDYKMDDLNGIETYNIMKDDLKENDTKTIIVSAYSKDIIDENLHNLGIEGYLSKPISPSTLYNKIFEVQNSIDNSFDNTLSSKRIKYFNNANILLVEDNTLNQEFAVHILTQRGFCVDIASDGIEALAKVKSKKYDLILMDIQMPHMDGLEATKHIRKMNGDYFAKVPIIALSANALLGDKEKSINIGMNEHITKPIDPVELFDILSQYLLSEEKDLKIESTQSNTNFDKLDKNIFDVENTLLKLNNSYEVYIKILKQFSYKYINIFQEIELYIKLKDMKSLQDKVHEIKGVCGNIGALRLFDRLISMDIVLKNGDYPNTQLLGEFKDELLSVLKSINVLESEKLILRDFNKSKVLTLLTNIDKNLEEDIVVCDKYLHEVLPYLGEKYQIFSNELSKSIDEFDTDKAKELIKDFVKDIK
jgi:PAS domain S-box-containing protein